MICVLVAAVLAGCGFEPLYGKKGDDPGTMAHLARIELGPIPDRVGQQVRNRLLEQMTPRGSAPQTLYHLEVALKEEKIGLLVESDDFVSRINLTLSANFTLTDKSSRARLMGGRTRTIASYNITRADYANLTAERDARRRAAETVADEIAARVAIFFKRQRDSAR